MATQYKCDICGKPASVHITKIIDNKKVKVHLCSECAEKASFDAVNLPMDILPKLQEFEKMIKKNIAKPTSDDNTCQTCGASLAEIEKGSRFSCPDCYIALGNKLFEILAGVHSSTEHKGKSPTNHNANCFVTLDTSKKLRDFEDVVGEELFEENLETALEEIATMAKNTMKVSTKVAKEKQPEKPAEPTEESLQKELEKAIEEERYEDAAKLRDKLKLLSEQQDG